MSLSEIAEYLKAPPFNLKVNLVTLDEQTPKEWLQLLGDILTTLNEQPRIDLRDETLEETAARLREFLVRTLNYKPPGGPFAPFRQSIFSHLFPLVMHSKEGF